MGAFLARRHLSLPLISEGIWKSSKWDFSFRHLCSTNSIRPDFSLCPGIPCREPPSFFLVLFLGPWSFPRKEYHCFFFQAFFSPSYVPADFLDIQSLSFTSARHHVAVAPDSSCSISEYQIERTHVTLFEFLPPSHVVLFVAAFFCALGTREGTLEGLLLPGPCGLPPEVP